MFDGAAFGEAIVAEVKAYLARETSALVARIVAFEQQLVERDAAEAERRDATAGLLDAMDARMAALETKSEQALALIGELGPELVNLPRGAMVIDTAALEESLKEQLRTQVVEAVAALPPAAPGQAAEPVTDDQIANAVRAHLAANPIPPAAPGQDGADGVGLAGALIDKDGQLVVTLTDGTLRHLGPVVGRDGNDGDPGRDGLTLSDFDTELSADGRFLTLSLQTDAVKVEHRLQLPTMIYRGVFKLGETYLEGDTVTFGGSLWHCNAETDEKPVDGNPAWTLAAKRGRDGKDAAPKELHA